MTSLQFKIKKPIELVFEHLSNMQKFVTVHPVIYKIENTGVNSYLVYETLKFGFIPFSFTYPASVEADIKNKRICIKATVFKITHIKLDFSLAEENGFTSIHENIVFTSPLPIKQIMASIFKKQHKKLFQNIELL